MLQYVLRRRAPHVSATVDKQPTNGAPVANARSVTENAAQWRTVKCAMNGPAVFRTR